MIDNICNSLFRLQRIIRDIRSKKISIDLNITFILINLINNEAYIIIKYYLKDMENLTLIHIKKQLKLIKHEIKNDSVIDGVANKKISNKKRSKKQNDKREYYYCNEQKHFKLKYFK